MTQKIPFVDSVGQCVTLVIDGKVFIISADNQHYPTIISELKNENWSRVAQLADMATSVEKYLLASDSGNVKAENGVVKYKGEILDHVIVDKIINFINDDKPAKPLINFIDQLMDNPSYNSREAAYPFLEKYNHPITPEGNVIAYKSLREDYTSIHKGVEPVSVSTDDGKTWVTYKGHIPNNIGNTVVMDRSLIDDNINNHCSVGLHVAALTYSQNSFKGSKLVVVEFNPRDIVAVPNDYSHQKLRVCRYKVISDFNGEITDSIYEG